MPRARRVLVSGAGIAGPTLAYWLQRHGFEPTVVERAPKPREGGYIFHFHGANGIEVLRRMGAWDKVVAHRRVDRETLFVDGRGRTVARLPTPEATAAVEPSGAQYTLRRADVARVLYEHTRDDVEYVFGTSIASLRQDGDGVDVEFEKGKARRFDLVVGADGLHSNVRRLAFGPEGDHRRFLGFYVAGWTMTDWPAGSGNDVVHLEPGSLTTVIGLEDDSAIAILLYRQPQESRYDVHDAEAQKALVRTAFRGAGWRLPEILDRMDAAEDFFFDSVSQVHMPSWSSGRVALVGDAAYCPSLLSGFGAQLGLTGAYVLAGELGRAAGDHAAAFASYERVLRPYVKQKQANPSHAAGFVPKSRFQVRRNHALLRLAALPVLSKLLVRGLYGGLLKETFELPRYEEPRQPTLSVRASPRRTPK